VKLQIRMITSIIESYPDASTHNITRKAMEALFSVADNCRTPLSIVCSVYESLEQLLVNYALSHFERKLIEALTSMQQNSKKQKTRLPLPSEGKSDEKSGTSPLSSRKSFLGLPSFHVRNLSGSGFSGSKNSKNTDSTISPLTPSGSQEDLSSLSSANSMGRSISTPDFHIPQAEPARLDRRNSLSKLPVLFTANAPLQQIVVPITISGPPKTNATTGSLLGSLSPQSKQRVIANNQDQIVIRNLHRTDEKTISRNSHIRKVLLLGLMVTSMYTAGMKQTEEKREHIRVNVLQLFERLHESEMHREAEVLLKFIPQLLEDFFDSEQILPLIYNEYTRQAKSHPSLLSLFLKVHLPAAYQKETGKDQPKKPTLSPSNKIPKSSFGDWITLSLETLVLKRPMSLALWGLLNLFICVCLCEKQHGQHHQSTFVEMGSVVPRSPSDTLFSHAFQLYGVCFYAFIQDKLSVQVTSTFKKILKQIVEDKDSDQEWKPLVISLQQLLDCYDQYKNAPF